MAQPYDYTSLVGSFENPQEAFAGQIKLRQAAMDAERQRQMQANMQTDLQSLQANPTPKAFADFYLKYPKAQDQVEAYRKTLAESDNRFIVDTAQEAFLLNRAGKPDDVLALFDQRIEALKNSNRPDMIDAAQRAKRLYQIAPDQKSREGALAMILYNYGGGENYDKVWGASNKIEMTSFQKNLVAAGIDPNSERGLKLSEDFAINQADPLVEMETPNNGKFVGPRSEYFRRYGTNAPEPTPRSPTVSAKPRVFSNVSVLPTDLQPGDVVNGKRFIGGPTNQPSSWESPKGGQSGSSAGTFSR
jgi:hypothetical protein